MAQEGRLPVSPRKDGNTPPKNTPKPQRPKRGNTLAKNAAQRKADDKIQKKK